MSLSQRALLRRERRRTPYRPRLEVLEDRSVPAVVGYYDIVLGRGTSSQVAPITTAGHTAVQLEDLTAAHLAGIDVLFVQNASNTGYGAEYLSRLGDISNAVAGGMTLIVHDRYVTGARAALPGASGISFVRNPTNNLDVADATITPLVNGPGGAVSNSNLDNLNFSTHGHAVASSLPSGARVGLNAGAAGQAVTFAYAHAAGMVIYSAIPLDFQLGRNNNLGRVYAPNVVAWGVELLNEAPVAAPVSVAGNEDVPLTGQLTASDGDGDALTFELVAGPQNGTLHLNAATGEYSYTAAPQFNGEDRFRFRVFDGRDYSADAEVVLTIAAVNDAPEVDPLVDVQTREGDVVSFSAVASDVEGDTLSYFWDFGDGTSAGGASVQHVYADNGDYAVTLTVSDGADSATRGLVVRATNEPPTQLDVGPDQTTNAGDAVALSVTFTDPGAADTHAFSWRVVDAQGQEVATATTARFDFTPLLPGSYTATVTVTDDDGASASASLSVTALVTNAAPVASLTGPTGGVRGQALVFTGSATDTDAGDVLTFAWQAADAQGRVIATGAGEQFSFTSAVAGAFTVSLTVTDRDGASSTASQAVTVAAVQLQANPIHAGLVDLVVGGTEGADCIVFEPARRGQVRVWLNGSCLGTFAPTGRLVAYGQGGNDVIVVSSRLNHSAWLDGGAGHDLLIGGRRDDVLIGGEGRDWLIGRGGRDLRVQGSLPLEVDAAAVDTVMREWRARGR